jgi:molecular chaperone GrpE
VSEGNLFDEFNVGEIMSESDVNQDDVSNESTDENAVDETEATDLETQLAEAQAKAEENWDQALRVKAEMENMRRRSERDVENAHKYALERFTQELLPVIDSLEMGTHAATAEGATLEKLQEGTELTLKMLLSVIDKFGIQAVHPEGEPFDPELHQAMSMLESPEHAPNTVMNVMQKGYLLNERLIRPAMVVVSKAASKSEDDA